MESMGLETMDNRGNNPPDPRRAFRIAWYGGAAVTVVAYAVLVPMKCHDLLPLRMTWSRVVIGPLLGGLMVPTAMLAGNQSGKKMWCWLLTWLLVMIALTVISSIFDPIPD